MHSESNDHEARLERSWRSNANAWSSAVREQRIASRRAGTDAAIVEAVAQTGARRVLDLGCGEGWLARELAVRGHEVVGVDGSPELIAAARALGGARFEVARYAELAAGADELGRFDAVVCNFALLGEDLQAPLHAARSVLSSDGTLLVQTVHPWVACGEMAYVDGWRIETFDAFGDGFREAMPWYFRTLATWADTLGEHGFQIERWQEPLAAESRKPLSLMLHAKPLTQHSPLA